MIDDKEINEFLSNHTTYLKDKGFSVKLLLGNTNFCMIIYSSIGEFMWSDVEDEIIPLFHMLNSKYKIWNGEIDIDSIVDIKVGLRLTNHSAYIYIINFIF